MEESAGSTGLCCGRDLRKAAAVPLLTRTRDSCGLGAAGEDNARLLASPPSPRRRGDPRRTGVRPRPPLRRPRPRPHPPWMRPRPRSQPFGHNFGRRGCDLGCDFVRHGYDLFRRGCNLGHDLPRTRGRRGRGRAAADDRLGRQPPLPCLLCTERRAGAAATARKRRPAPRLPRTPVGERQPGGDDVAGGSRGTDASRRAVRLALARAGAVWAGARGPLPTPSARDAGRELLHCT